MENIRAGKSWIILVSFILTTGCAHVISSEMRQQATQDLPFPLVLENPTAYVGQTVIVGGLIIESVNRQNETEMVILETPLDYRGMPRSEEYSRGRFIARIPGYLDPEVLKKDRKITLAGEIVSGETRSLGEIQYTYPVLHVRELHIWREVIRYSPYGPYYWDYYWYGHPYYWPHYRFHYYYHW